MKKQNFKIEFKIFDEEDNVLHKGKKQDIKKGTRSIEDFVCTKLGEKRLQAWVMGK
jgi:hypothetical protein